MIKFIFILLLSVEGFCMNGPWKVDDGVYRGSQPITIDDYINLQQIGIKYILDLENGSRLLADGSPLEEQLEAEKYGIKVFNLPLGEILAPSQHQLDDAMSFIEYHKPVYVHCKAGVDRTGIVIGRYRIEMMNWPVEKAIQEIKDMGMHIWYYPWLGVLR
jgi:protein-tyrosine phosphatase